MPNFGMVAKFNKIPSLGFVPESSASAPGTPVSGQLWIDTSVTPKLMKVWDGSAWAPTNLYGGSGAANYVVGNDVRLSDQRVPLDGSVTGGAAGAGVKLATSTITDVNVAAANKDGISTTLSLRTLGTGAQQAAAGNDARLSDTRTPSAGSVSDASVATNAAIAESKLALASDAAAATPSRRTLSFAGNSAMPGTARLDQISAPTAAVSVNGQKIINLGAPTLASDAARLADVQAAAAGIDVKPSVRVASNANVVVASGLVTTTVLDGVPLVTGDRVLLKNQTTATENGAYVVPAAGAAVRDTDTITANSFWFVEEGTVNADTSWMVNTNGVITLGTTPLSIAQFGAPGSVSGTANRITSTGGVIDISAAYVGQTSITTLGTVVTGTWTGTAIAVGSGGTGAIAPLAARANLGAAQAGYRAVVASALVAGTPLLITHNLNTDNCIAQIRDAVTGEYVMLDIIDAPATPNTLTITSGVAYAANTFDIVVIPV